MPDGIKITEGAELMEQCGIALMVARVTADGLVVTACNEANARMTGYSRDELIGSRPDDTTLSPDTDLQSMHQAMRSARRGEPGIFASRFKRKDGKLFAARCMISGRYDEDGKLTHYVFVSTPIDPGNPGLHWFGSQGLLAHAERVGGTGAWRFDFGTGALSCSDNCYALFGLVAGSDMTQRIMNLLPEEEQTKVRKASISCRASCMPTKLDITFYRDDGSRRDACLSMHTECDASGAVTGLIGVVHDVTEMRTLRRKQKMFLRAARIGFIEVNMTTRMISYSADTSVIIGTGEAPGRMSVEEWQGRVHPEDIEQAMVSFEAHVHSQETFIRRYRFQADDRSYRWVEIRAAAHFDPGQNTPMIFSTIADIDDQVRAGEELDDIRTRLDLAVDAAGLGLWSLDLHAQDEDDAMSWSAHMRQILGLDDDAGASWPVLESLIHPDDRERVTGVILNASETLDDGAFTIEHRCIRPDGAIIWVENRGLARHDAHGRVVTIAGALMDITARKSAEADLVRSERRFHDVTAITGECIFELDAQGRFIYLSEAARQVYGYAPKEMLGKHPMDFTPAHERTHKGWINNARKNRGWCNVEREIRRKDSSRGWITVNGRAIFDAENALTGFRGAIADSTERHSFIEQLLQSKQRTDDVVRIADACIFDLDTQGGMTYLSDSARQLFGAAPEDLIGKPTYTLAKDLKPRHQEWLQAIRQSDSGLESEIKISPLDGRADLWARTTCRVLTSDAGDVIGYRGIAIDVTARRQAALEIIKAKQAAEAAAEERARFLSTMSHEIRTPLNAVIGMTDLMLDMEQSEEQQRLTASANTAGRHLLGLVNDILDFSKLEADRLEIEKTDFILEEEIDTVRAMLLVGARDKGLGLNIKIAPGAGGGRTGDPARLRQILVNLVSNAIKFTSEGKITIAVTPAKAGHLRFCIRDTGIGISKQALPGLFQDFFQADSSITRRFGGTGLGLAISKRLTERMGGTIGAESTPGEGSTFWFEIPLPRSKKTKTAPRKRRQHSVADKSWHVRVLVAEDNPANQMLIKTILERMNHEVVIVGDGKAAVQTAMAAPFDVILMDVQMPEMDGVSAARVLRKKGCKTPIIALTAHVLADEKDRFAAAGMTAWLSKPFEARALAKTMYQCTRPQSNRRVRKKA